MPEGSSTVSTSTTLRNVLDHLRSTREILLQRVEETEKMIEETQAQYERILLEESTNQDGADALNPSAPRRGYIDNLPNEILLEIFEVACEGSNEFNLGSVGADKPYTTALDISVVCSLWRGLSLQQTSLWTSLGVILDKGSDERYQRSVLNRYLRRSGGHPLYLWFSFEACSLGADHCLVADAVAHSNRIRRFSVYFGSPRSPQSSVKCILAFNWPLLETLEIDVAPTQAQFRLPKMTYSGRFDQLKELRSPPEVFHGVPTIEFSNLTTIQIERLSESWRGTLLYPWTLLCAIFKVPLLESLSIRGKVFHKADIAEEGIVAKNLKYFRCGDRNVAVRMWSEFQLPVLEVLVLCDIFLAELLPPFDSDTYRSQVPPSQLLVLPSLHTLAFVNCIDGLQSPFPHWLALSTGQVNHLIFVERKNTRPGNLFNKLIRSVGKIYWPNLTYITFETGSPKAPPFDNPTYVFNFMIKRSSGSKSCTLGICVENEQEIRQHQDLAELEDSGMVEFLPWQEDQAQVPWPCLDHFSIRSETAFNPVLQT